MLTVRGQFITLTVHLVSVAIQNQYFAVLTYETYNL